MIYTIFLLYGMADASFSEMSVPNEYQEVSNVQMTEAFLSGQNPYAFFDAVEQEKPGTVYAYGPLYPLLTALFCRLLPIDHIFAHYLISFLSMLAAAALGAWMVREQTETLLPPVSAFLLIINCTWRYGYVNAVPDALAFLWVMLVFFVETRKNFRGREVVEVILVIAAVYTKMYMGYIALPLFLCKLIHDKKAAVRFAAEGIVLMTVFTAAVTFCCPLLWTFSVFIPVGPWGITDEEYASVVNRISMTDTNQLKDVIEVLTFQNTEDPSGGLGYEMLQLRSLIGMFLFFYIAVFAGVCEHIKKRFSEMSYFQWLMLMNLAVSVPVLFVLGTNSGAWLSYYLQIQVPALVMYAVVYAEQKCLSQKKRVLQAASVTGVFLALLFTIYRTDRRLPYYYMTGEQKQIWTDTYALLDRYLEEGEIYYSPVLAFHAEKNRQYYYNNGFVGGSGSRRRYAEWLLRKWEQIVFPGAGRFMQKHISFQDEIRRRIQMGEYALITVIEGEDGTDRVVEISEIEKGPYQLLRVVDMPMSRENFPVRFYIPAGSK